LAARSDSAVRVERPLIAADTLATRTALAALGVPVTEESGAWVVGPGVFSPPDRVLDCGNSGTTLRLLMAQAALLPATIQLDGDASLRRRSSAPLLNALRQLGVASESVGGCAPLTLRGPMRGGAVAVEGQSSSQFASALVLALPFAERDSVVTVRPPLHSRPYLEMSVAMARSAGLRLTVDAENGVWRAHIPAQQMVNTAPITIGGDWSSAAMIMVAAALSDGEVEISGLDQNSLQGDRKIIDILRSFGVVVRVGEVIRVGGAPTASPGLVDLRATPDLFPPVCALAACAPGTTNVVGSAALRVKESDRVAAMAAGLGAAGIAVEHGVDGLFICGGEPRGAVQQARDDHRVHMALTALALAADGPSTIDGSWSVQTSYPAFHRDLALLLEPELLSEAPGIAGAHQG
jgi:3-phosphoshikimate 1-carboxyvinyltransferase